MIFVLHQLGLCGSCICLSLFLLCNANFSRLFLTSLFSFRGRGGRKSSDRNGAIKLYLDLLAEANERGLNRTLAQTPTEIKPELIEIYNDDFPSQITKLFEEERYGNHPAILDDVENARVVWEKSQSD